LAIAIRAEIQNVHAPWRDYSCILLIKKDTGNFNELTKEATAPETLQPLGYYSNRPATELAI
jgi:hypothetical protein